MTDKTNIKHIKPTDTALINEICDLGDITIDARTRWSIEFDDYGIQGVVDAIRKNFVEQVCEAVDEVFNNGNYVCVNRFDIKQAIRDKFK